MPAMKITTEHEKNSLLLDTTVAFNNPWRWSVPLVAAVALLVLLALGDNVQLFYFMNRIMSYASDGLWTHLTLLGDGQIVVLFILPFLGRRPDVVWQYVLAALLAGSFHLNGPDLQNNAFPSGHTTAFFVLAGLVCLHRTKVWFKFAILLLAIFVGLSRIANGVHWPVDVLGAAMGGWLVAIVAVWLAQYWRAGLNVWVQRIFALILTLVSLWAVWSLWHHYDDVYPGTHVMQVLLFVACLALSVPGQLRLFNLKR